MAWLEDEVRAERLQEELLARLGKTAQRAMGGGATRTAASVVTDRQDLVGHVQAQLVPGEFLHAVLDLKVRGPGFFAITSRRVLLYDRRVRAVVFIGYDHILAIGARDEDAQFATHGLAVSNTVVLSAAHGTFELPLQSPEKARVAHELILRYLL